MRTVTAFEQFRDEFEEHRTKRRLFGFILFDDRPSHKAVAKFTADNFTWLDQLADGANMYVYAFSQLNERREWPPDNSSYAKNPSMQVASLFGIRPNQLPGIVLFTMLSASDTVDHGVFLPIAARLFVKDEAEVESVFSDLFSMLQKCQHQTRTEAELFRSISYSIGEVHAARNLRGIGKYLHGTLQSLSKFPEKLLEAIFGAWAKAMIP